jgi:hypothetical protein
MMGMLMTSKHNISISLKSLQDIDDLMADLRRARRMARRTGGQRYVKRTNDCGDFVVFEISVPYGECK